MSALFIMWALLWTPFAIESSRHGKPEKPRDCETYNVGRVECGARSGGNPREALR